MKKLIVLIFILTLLSSSHVWGATHYVSASGTASWLSSTNINTPCSLSTAMANAGSSEPDLVYLRDVGGAYTVDGGLWTNYSGTGSSDSQYIIFRAYPGETPTINSTTHDGGDDGSSIFVEHDYWWFDGLTINAYMEGSSGDRGIIRASYDGTARYLKVTNCTLHITSMDNCDNHLAILFNGGTSSNYGYVYNNDIIGPSSGRRGAGVGFLGSGNIGTKILKNNFHNFEAAVVYKHNNGDTSLTSGAEFAYNYAYSMVSYTISGNPCYVNIHDNIMVGDTELNWNGGGSAGVGSLYNHNTFKGQFLVLNEFSSPSFTLTNNAFTGGYNIGAGTGTYSYNIYGAGYGALGSNDIANATPTFLGGTSPTTPSGFKLTGPSSALNSSNDTPPRDRGADVSLVGITGGSCTGDCNLPVIQGISAVQGLSIR